MLRNYTQHWFMTSAKFVSGCHNTDYVMVLYEYGCLQPFYWNMTYILVLSAGSQKCKGVTISRA